MDANTPFAGSTADVFGMFWEAVSKMKTAGDVPAVKITHRVSALPCALYFKSLIASRHILSKRRLASVGVKPSLRRWL